MLPRPPPGPPPPQHPELSRPTTGTVFVRPRVTAEEVIKSLDPGYFTEGFDGTKHILALLPERPTEKELEAKLEEQDTTMEVISTRLSKQVLDNYSQFVDGMTHVRDVQMELTVVSVLCNNARRLLTLAHRDLTQSILPALARARKKKRMMGVHAILLHVSKLMQDEEERQRLIEQGEFVRAVDLYYSSIKSLKLLSKLSCVADLYERVKNGKDEISAKLFVKLTDFTRGVDSIAIENVIRTYEQLGELHTLSGLINKAFIDATLQQFYSIAARHMVASDKDLAFNTLDGKAPQPKLPLTEICKLIDRDSFVDCYLRIVEHLSDVLYYYLKANEAVDAFCKLPPEQHIVSNEALEPVRRELVQSKEVIWVAVQDRLIAMLQSITLSTSTIQLEEFLKLLRASFRIIAIGEHFSGGRAAGFRAAMQQKSTEYVDNFHKENFEYLRLTLENETWRWLPLPPGFTMLDIKELRTIQRHSVHQGGRLDDGGDERIFQLFVTGVNVFRKEREDEEAIEAEERRKEDLNARAQSLLAQTSSPSAARSPAPPSSPSPSPAPPSSPYPGSGSGGSESKRDDSLSNGNGLADGKDDKLATLPQSTWGKLVSGRPSSGGSAMAPLPSVLLTSSSINMARYVAKYVHIMEMLPPLAVNALHGLAELFDVYIYTLFNLFGVNAQRFYSDAFDRNTFPRLRTAVLTIRNRIEQNRFGGLSMTASLGGGSDQLIPTFMMTLDDALNAQFQHFTPHPPSSLPPPQGSTPNLLSPPASPRREGKDGDADGTSPTPSPSSSSSSSTTTTTTSTTTSMFQRFGRSASNTSFLGGKKEPAPAPVLVTSRMAFTPANGQGLVERLVSSELMVFLVQIMRTLEHRIALLLPKTEQFRVAKFLTYAEEVSRDYRKFMHKSIPPLVLKMEPHMQLVGSVKWTIDELSTKNSAYVDKLLQSLKEVDKVIKTTGGLPESLSDILWKEVSEYIMEELLTAYGKIKKCSAQGRALMSLDLNLLTVGLQSLSNLKTIPGHDKVHQWVKGFYYSTEETFLQWMQDHPEYTLEQYTNLALCSIGTTKKESKELVKKIEEMYKTIKNK